MPSQATLEHIADQIADRLDRVVRMSRKGLAARYARANAAKLMAAREKKARKGTRQRYAWAKFDPATYAKIAAMLKAEFPDRPDLLRALESQKQMKTPLGFNPQTNSILHAGIALDPSELKQKLARRGERAKYANIPAGGLVKYKTEIKSALMELINQVSGLGNDTGENDLRTLLKDVKRIQAAVQGM